MKFKKIYIEITNICNKKCDFCSVDKKIKKEMTTLEFEKILKQVKEYTNYIYLHVKGEPLMHSNIEEILNICKLNNMNVNITTNGTLLRKKIDILMQSDIRQLNISMHSFDDDNYVNDIIYSVNELKNKENLSIVYRFWALKNGLLSNINLKILNKILSTYENRDELYSKCLTVKNIKLESNVYVNKLNIFSWPSLDNKFVSDKGFCQGIKTHIAILSDGTVVPCCLDNDGIIELGNIFEKSLKEILFSERFVNMKENMNSKKLNEKLCQHCSYRENWQ